MSETARTMKKKKKKKRKKKNESKRDETIDEAETPAPCSDARRRRLCSRNDSPIF